MTWERGAKEWIGLVVFIAVLFGTIAFVSVRMSERLERKFAIERERFHERCTQSGGSIVPRAQVTALGGVRHFEDCQR